MVMRKRDKSYKTKVKIFRKLEQKKRGVVNDGTMESFFRRHFNEWRKLSILRNGLQKKSNYNTNQLMWEIICIDGGNASTYWNENGDKITCD